MAQEAPPQSALEKRLYGLWELGGRELAAEAWKWPKEERMMLAREFRAYLKSGKFGKPEGSGPYDILIRLGDREATRRDVQKMAADPSHDDPGFDTSGSPIAIEYLAPYAFSQEPYKEIRASDVYTAPFSFMVTSVIFEILSESSAFTGEVRNWARREKVPDPVSERAELQRWWNENKIHFEQEDYKAVQPGLPIASVFEVMDESRRKAGLPPLDYKRPPQPTQPPPATPKPAPAPLPAAEAPHSSNALYYIAAAAGALLAAALAIAARRKRGKSN